MAKVVSLRRSRALFLVLALCAACQDEGEPAGPMGPGEPEPICTQDNLAFVREATLAVVGRRPLSLQEARSAAALIDEINELDKSPGATVGRRVWLEGMMSSPEFVARWQEIFLDALQVPRTDVQALSDCYGTQKRTADDAELAKFVRDHDARKTGIEPFSFLDLLRSSLELDDLSPIYRAHLFAMLTKPNICPNVDPVASELAVRQEVGHVFDAGYTNRDQVCLSCHNSEASVTFRPQTSENRHFAIAAHLEKAVFGTSKGVSDAVPHAVFRTTGLLNSATGEMLDCGDDSFAYCESAENGPTCGNGAKPTCRDGSEPSCTQELLVRCAGGSATSVNPWGADPGCGTFNAEVEDDPADVDAHLATVRGKRATVFELEQALKRGVDSLARDGLVVTAKGDVKDSEAALAYLVALNIVDRVWKEVVGSSLTIATRFPRTQAAHDLLERLANHFVAEHYSLRTLLRDIVETEEFNALAPADGCGEAYAMSPVFDPWVRDEPELERRRNSAADGVHPLSPRALMSATYAALGWPVPEGSRFPGAGGGSPDDMMDGDDMGMLPEEGGGDGSAVDELGFQRSIGVFLGISQKGFRGLDLSARLAWEERFGSCTKPDGVESDALDAILERGIAQEATLEDAVLALKDRLIGGAQLDEGEAELLEDLLGAKLSAKLTTKHAAALRQLCGALLSSPEHLLGGLPALGEEAATLGPTSAETCRALRKLSLGRYQLRCEGGSPQVTLDGGHGSRRESLLE